MDNNVILKKHISIIKEIDEENEHFITDPEDVKEKELKAHDEEFCKLNELYDECLEYLKQEYLENFEETTNSIHPDYESVEDTDQNIVYNHFDSNEISTKYQIENELKSNESINTCKSEPRSDRLRRLSKTLPKIIITQSNTSLNIRRSDGDDGGQNIQNINKRAVFKSLPKINYKYAFEPRVNGNKNNLKVDTKIHVKRNGNCHKAKKDEKKMIGNGKKKSYIADNYKIPFRPGHPDFPKRLVSKRGIENVALISNVPFERIRMLNDTFHTLINLRWRWIVSGTVVVHFAIWLVFAVFWYIAALAHYDFEPNPPKRTCVTGGHDFLTIFLASVEAQTTIGFGDRAIDEECPESIFLFIMQLILGTGLSGVLTCVVYAKLTRPEKLSRDGVGFSKKAVISTRDGNLCLMMRAWDLNYDHIISSEFTAHFIHTHRTKEGEVIRYYAEPLALQQRQFLLWPVTLLHVIDRTSPLYQYGPELVASGSYEITVSLKGASASMGTFTQSQTSYLPKEVMWGHRFPPVVKYDSRKQKYVIDHNNLNATESVDTPSCSAHELNSSTPNTRSTSTEQAEPTRPGTPNSFSERISSFHLERSSSFRNNTKST